MKKTNRMYAYYVFFIGIFLILTIPGLVMAQDDHALEPGDESPEKSIQIDVSPETTFDLGGAMWWRIASQDWVQPSQANKRAGFYFDQFRLSGSGKYAVSTSEVSLEFSWQVRWWYYMFAVQHAWMGVRFNDQHSIKIGVTRTPFGILPATSNSFWYSMAWYHGLEDEGDAGVEYHYTNDPLDLYLAFYTNEEYNDPTALNRFSPDVVSSGDQQNEEQYQGNIRFAYTFGSGTSSSSEFGFSGQYGGLKNRTTTRTGTRWQAAAHYVGNYGQWNPKLQVARYEYHPENPDGVDNRLVLMGFFSDQRLVAANANAVCASLRRFFDVNWGPIKDLNIYIDYSTILKDEADFADSQLFNPGWVMIAGPMYLWFDLLWAKNGWWHNDSQDNSGPGAGSIRPDKWEFRGNLSIMWFF